MGTCVTKLEINEDLALVLKANPNDALLLTLQLHYDSYDKKSQKIIDACTQLAISRTGGIILSNGSEAINEDA